MYRTLAVSWVFGSLHYFTPEEMVGIPVALSTGKNIVFYSTEAGECYLKSVLSNLTPFSKRVLTRSVHILSAYLDTGIIPKRIVPIEEHPLPGEIGEAAHLFLEELVNSRRNDITVLKHRRNLSYFIEFLETKSKSKLCDIGEDEIVTF